MTVTSQQIQNVKLGSCNVSYGGLDLGLTKGGVAVTIATQNKAIMIDQFSQSVMNDYIMGRSGTVKVPMAETDLNKLQNAIPGSILVTGTTTGSNPAPLLLQIPTAVGMSLVDTALPLILHPTALAAMDLSQDVTVPLAAPTGNITFDFQAENERIYMVEFTMYPNPTTGLLCTIGPPTTTGTSSTTPVAG